MTESKPKREEINSHTIKLIVGIIAISLAVIVSWIADSPLTSISQSYTLGGLPRNIFVGFLFAIAAFLFAYNGQSTSEMLLSRGAAICAIGVAIFECVCDRPNMGTNLHMIFAVSMFIILAVFCLIFLRRARKKDNAQAKWRVYLYVVCGITLVLAMATMAIDMLGNNFLTAKFPRLIFYGEASGLTAFGIAWLLASRTLPFITAESERNSLSPFQDTGTK